MSKKVRDVPIEQLAIGTEVIDPDSEIRGVITDVARCGANSIVQILWGEGQEAKHLEAVYEFHRLCDHEIVEEDFLECDICGKHITDFESDLFHFSGTSNGKVTGHIHVCKLCVMKRPEDFPFIDVDALKSH